MMIFCVVLVLLQGTLSASLPENNIRNQNLGSVFQGLLKRSSSLSREMEYEVAKDEIPQNEVETGNVSIPAIGCGSRPAFYAYLSSTRCYHTGQTIIFDREWLDTGKSYSVDSGVFVVKTQGLYAFTWTVAAEKGTWFISELRVNSNLRGRVMTDSDLGGRAKGIHPATGFALVNVKKGDQVFIRYARSNGCKLQSDAYTLATFSGWRIA